MLTLYQFKFSHFCEKARWALDYKGMPFEQQNLLLGFHEKAALKIAPKTELPILIDGDTVVQDSTSIITFLDKRYPYFSLTSPDPEEAKSALDWEDYLDEKIGVPIRLWFYHYFLPDRSRTLSFLLDGASLRQQQVFTLKYPIICTKMRESMNINYETAQRAEAQFLAALDRLDDAVQKNSFLVGNRFSRADLTACSLLSVFCAPDMTEAEITSAFPEPVWEMRETHKSRPYFNWVNDIYREFR